MSFTCKIDEMNLMGNGITRMDGCVVFCLGAVDGDTVTCEITENKKNFKIARVLSVDSPSPFRQESDCPNFPHCGGCDLRHISYEHEVEVKKLGVESALRKAGLGHIPVSDIIYASPEAYRNKAVFRFGEGVFGFSETKSDTVTSAEGCRIVPEIFCRIGEFTLNYFGESISDISYLFLRRNHDCSEISALLGTKNEGLDALPYATALYEKFPCVAGVLTKAGAHPEDGIEPRLILKNGYINEKFLDLSLKVSPSSFFQVNHAAAEMLCRKAAEYALSGEGKFGADLYCGTGIFAMKSDRSHVVL